MKEFRLHNEDPRHEVSPIVAQCRLVSAPGHLAYARYLLHICLQFLCIDLCTPLCFVDEDTA